MSAKHKHFRTDDSEKSSSNLPRVRGIPTKDAEETSLSNQSNNEQNEDDFVDNPVSDDEYARATGETLAQTLDLKRWKKGVEAFADYERHEAEIHEAQSISNEVRETIRNVIFPELPKLERAPKDAGVWQLTQDDVATVHKNVLMNGLVEGCDGNVHVHSTLALQIVQIAVTAVTYKAEEEAWAHRIYKRDIRVSGGADMIDETLKLLRKRSPNDDDANKPRRVTEMMRRGVMTFMERQVLATASRAPWRLGHGNPLPYELLTGSGSHELIKMSIPVLQKLILDHKKFVFVPSDTKEEHIRTIGDALLPLEYAIISDMKTYIDRVESGGYRGDWGKDVLKQLKALFREAEDVLVMGAFRATPFAPAQVFYAHKDYVHEAALIAISDSVHLDHRGFPMLIEMADQMCRAYFGAETLERPTITAFAQGGEPFRHLSERSTRG